MVGAGELNDDLFSPGRGELLGPDRPVIQIHVYPPANPHAEDLAERGEGSTHHAKAGMTFGDIVEQCGTLQIRPPGELFRQMICRGQPVALISNRLCPEQRRLGGPQQ